MVRGLVNDDPAVAQSGLRTLEIQDTTPIDVDTNGVGASGSGWVAKVRLQGITSLVGTLDPTKLTLNVSDPGFDGSGNATTVTRTITGVSVLRRQYPNGASKMISTSGGDLYLLISLSDYIYAGTTITSASIASGFYTGASASDAGTIRNKSALTYRRPVAGWLNTQFEAATGNTKHVELVAFHPEAQQGRMVACIKFTASDGTHTGTTSVVNDTTLSTIQTTGNIAETFVAEVDCSTMTQGTLFTVDAVIYPWLGTAYSLKTDGYVWPTTLPGTALNVFCDRTGAYGAGAVFAYYQAGAGTGTVSATAATARSSPFGTWSTMIAAIKTFMNANRGHNDIGGAVIRLMDTGGADTTLTVGGSWGSSLAGLTWVTVEPDPLNTGLITLTASSNFTAPTLVHWRGVKLTGSGFLIIGPGSTPASASSNDRTMCRVDGCSFISGGSFNPSNYNMYWYKDCTWARSTTLVQLATIYDGVVCVLGGSSTGNIGASGNYINAVIGLNYLAPGATELTSGRANATAADGALQRIFYNVKAWRGRWQNTAAITPMEDMVIANCLFEMDDSNSNNVTCNVFADGDLTTIKNGMEFHNTGVGDRCSHYYNDGAGSNVAPNAVPKQGIARFCIWDNVNIKSDYFSVPSAGSGSPGNWNWLYQVGNHGNVDLFGAVSRSASDAPQNTGVDQYMGCAWQADSEPNLQLHGLTKAQIMALFTSYTVAPQAVPAMGGNYQPVHAAQYITSRVPAGKSVFKYDIAGNLRATDGTGAAGAYEQAA